MTRASGFQNRSTKSCLTASTCSPKRSFLKAPYGLPASQRKSALQQLFTKTSVEPTAHAREVVDFTRCGGCLQFKAHHEPSETFFPVTLFNG